MTRRYAYDYCRPCASKYRDCNRNGRKGAEIITGSDVACIVSFSKKYCAKN